MPKPITTLEDVQRQVQGVLVSLRVNMPTVDQLVTLADCVRTLATICMQQRDELTVLRKAVASDKPAIMRNREMK